MEHIRSSGTNSTGERPPSESSSQERSPARKLSRLAPAAAALAVFGAAPVEAVADETGHQVIAIVETGLEFDSDTKVIDVICEATGPEISCEVKQAPENKMPSWQEIHGHFLLRTRLGKFTVEDRYGNIISENTEMENPGIFIAETGVPFAEAHLMVFDDDEGNAVPAWILKPIIQNGIVAYTVEEMFNTKELLGQGGYTTDYYQGKMMGVSDFSEDNGKKHFVTLEKKDGIWQITEKNEMPEEYDPWDSIVLENYPGGKKIAIANGVLGVAIHESGNMKEPFLIFYYPEYQEEIKDLKLHPNGKFLIASGNVGFFILDIEDPSNYTYIFGASRNYGFDEKGIGQNFLSYVEIVNQKPLEIKITKYELNSFNDSIWNGSDEDNPIPIHEVMAGIEKDEDKDKVTDFFDNCYALPNPDQLDTDGDGIGDACEQVEPIDPESEPAVEEGNPELEESPEPLPEESVEPEESEPNPEPVTVEEVGVAEPPPDVIEPPKDGAEESPEVVQPEDTMEEDIEKADAEPPEDENTPKDTVAEEDGGFGDWDTESDGSTDEKDKGTGETAEEKDTSGGSPDVGNTDLVSGNDLSADAGGPVEKDVSAGTPQSPGAGSDGGCTMGTNPNNGNPFIIFGIMGAGAGLALAQRRRRQMMEKNGTERKS